jgi:DNA-binding NarL/FixJ family response regulator
MIIYQRQVSMKRVFVLSCHPLFGQGVELLLSQEAGLDIVGRETDLDRAIERIQELRPDVVIVDSNDSAYDLALVVMRILRERLPTRVIGLNLQENILCIYHGEQRVIKRLQDLVEAIQEQESGSGLVNIGEGAIS